jgi:hypothetical protein
MVSPEIVTVFDCPTWKTRLPLFALTVSLVAPGPEITRLLLINSSPLVRVIVAGNESAKLMLSFAPAAAIAARKVPGPLSAVLVTVIVPATAEVIVNSPSKRISDLGDRFMCGFRTHGAANLLPCSGEKVQLNPRFAGVKRLKR